MGLHRMGGDLSSFPRSARRSLTQETHAHAVRIHAAQETHAHTVRCVVLLVCTTTYVHTSQSHEGEWLVPLFPSKYLHTYIM